MADIVASSVAAFAIIDNFLQDSDDDELAMDVIGISSVFRDDRAKCEQYYEKTVKDYLPDTFKRFFKFNRETVNLLCQLLSDCPELSERKAPGGRPSIPNEKKILMTLRYLASQETLLELSDRFGVTEFSFLRCKRQVIEAIINKLFSKFICWPKNDEIGEITRRFDDMGVQNFPNIIGAIDGSHIRIEAPSENPNCYFNRKKFHSVILQAVCTDELKFIDINVGWPGRVHDAKVLKNSNLWETGFSKCHHGLYHLIGDAAYPLKEWLLTPYRDTGHLTQQQLRYNMSLSSKRQVIERAFAMLKSRFRRLKYLNLKSVSEICQTIVCTCILHNICIMEADYLDDALNDDDEDDDDDDGNLPVRILNLLPNDAQGHLKRLNITNRI